MLRPSPLQMEKAPMAKLTVSSTTDFSGLPLLQIDLIEFINRPGTTAVATFSGVQLGSPRISPQVLIDGSAGNNAIVVNGTGTPVNLSGWQFMDWDAMDSVLIRGNSLSETLTGSSQNDTILGLGGSDTIDGGAGDDVIEGGRSIDRLNGGSGIDTLSYQGSTSAVTVNLASGLASGGDAFGDRFSGFENIAGSAYNDTLTGDAGANALSGENGNDRLSGGQGSDVLIGGKGRDTMTGGGNTDRFIYTAIDQSVVGSNRDVITDFRQSEKDLIDLSAIDAIPNGADNAFDFIGTNAFTASGQVRYQVSNGQTIIQVNQDGGSLDADMEIALSGTHALTAGDFIL
jgi:Ca2+-binding RTX toxin-like protein